MARIRPVSSDSVSPEVNETKEQQQQLSGPIEFKFNRKELSLLLAEKNPAHMEITGGIDFIARGLCTNLDSGISLEEYNWDGLKKRTRHFGKNRFHWMKSIVDAFSFARKIRQALNRLSFECTVLRFEKEWTIDWHDVLVGDIVLLKKGDLIPADGILFHGDGMEVDEGFVYSAIADEFKIHIKSDDYDPFLFSLTQVINGRGRMLVTCLGDNSSMVHHLDTLQLALFYNCFVRAEQLLRKGVSPNLVSGRGGLMLVHYIAKTGTTEQMQILIRHGADMNRKTPKQEASTLDLALIHNEPVAHFLIDSKKCNVDSKDIYGRSSIFTAVRYRDWNTVSQLVETCNADMSVRDVYGWNVLMYAVVYGTEEMVEGLLQMADIARELLQQSDIEGNTCLILATVFVRVGIIEKLICAGADVLSQNMPGRTALHHIAMGDLNPIFVYYGHRRRLVQKCGREYVPLVYHPKSLGEGAPTGNSSSRSISTSSTRSSGSGRQSKKNVLLRKEKFDLAQNYANALKIYRLLIEAGANVNAVDSNGFGPVHYAVLGGKENQNNAFRQFMNGRNISRDTVDGKESQDQNRSLSHIEPQMILEQSFQTDRTTVPSRNADGKSRTSTNSAIEQELVSEHDNDDEFHESGETFSPNPDDWEEDNDEKTILESEKYFRNVVSSLIELGAKLDLKAEEDNTAARKSLPRNGIPSHGFPKVETSRMPPKPKSRAKTASMVTADLIKRNKEANMLIKRKRPWIIKKIF